MYVCYRYHCRDDDANIAGNSDDDMDPPYDDNNGGGGGDDVQSFATLRNTLPAFLWIRL